MDVFCVRKGRARDVRRRPGLFGCSSCFRIPREKRAGAGGRGKVYGKKGRATDRLRA